MLPTSPSEAFTQASTSDYLSLATREQALPSTLAEFMALLGLNAKKHPQAASAAIGIVVRHLQAGAPEAPSIQLWLLVAYAPALQAMAMRHRTTGASLKETESVVVWAFLETLQGLGDKRLTDPCLMLELVRDTRRRVAYHGGFWAGNHAGQVETATDEALMADRLPDDRADAYQALQDLIRDLPVSEAERTLLIGLHVYNHSLKELAFLSGEAYDALQKRHFRLMARLRKKAAGKTDPCPIPASRPRL